MTINQIVGNNIRKLREENGFTQIDFAEACEISRAYYGRIERGEHSITIDTCSRIAKTLGIEMYKLFINI